MGKHCPGCHCYGQGIGCPRVQDVLRRLNVRATPNLKHETPKPRTDFAPAA